MTEQPPESTDEVPVPLRDRIAAMRWRLVGAALALCFYALCWVAVAAGASALAAPLIVLPVLVVLVAAGNWFQHWLGISRSSPRYAEAPRRPQDPSQPR